MNELEMRYSEKYPVGSGIMIVGETDLRVFADEWKYHHPLQLNQFAYAGTKTSVKGVFFYHGGDPIYELNGVPGYWHERCLRETG